MFFVSYSNAVIVSSQTQKRLRVRGVINIIPTGNEAAKILYYLPVAVNVKFVAVAP